MIFFLVLFIPTTIFSKDLTLCYDVKALFVTVGTTCIHYKIDNKTIYFDSTMKSSPAVSWVSRINNFGKAIGNLDDLKSKYFLFHQEEGKYKAFQEYFFENNKIKVKSIKYNQDWTVKDENEKIYDIQGYYEPFMLSLVFYKKILEKHQTPLKLFYKEKIYDIPFSIHSETVISISKRKFNTVKISFTPNIKGKGLLIPSGRWFIYIDKERLFPVRIDTKFVFITASVIISKIEGNEFTISSILKNQGK
ncbi:MAG: DUF3108 domain-containing protein [Deferribacterales bacterium]